MGVLAISSAGCPDGSAGPGDSNVVMLDTGLLWGARVPGCGSCDFGGQMLGQIAEGVAAV